MDIVALPNGKTWRDELDIEASEVKAQGIIDARAAEHQKDSVAHRTLNHDDGHITPYVDLAQNQAREWDSDLLWNAGPVKNYREGAPNGYTEQM